MVKSVLKALPFLRGKSSGAQKAAKTNNVEKSTFQQAVTSGKVAKVKPQTYVRQSTVETAPPPLPPKSRSQTPVSTPSSNQLPPLPEKRSVQKSAQPTPKLSPQATLETAIELAKRGDNKGVEKLLSNVSAYRQAKAITQALTAKVGGKNVAAGQAGLDLLVENIVTTRESLERAIRDIDRDGDPLIDPDGIFDLATKTAYGGGTTATPEMINHKLHCKAGIGRTMTSFAAAELLIKMRKGEIRPDNVDKVIDDTIIKMREARGPNSVQTKSQRGSLRKLVVHWFAKGTP